MDKRNKNRAGLSALIGVAAAGRALLSVPENAAIQEVSLTVLALVGYLLLASKSRLPVLFGAAGLVLELILSGVPAGGASVWLIPALRVADLWLFWGASVVLPGWQGRQGGRVPYPCGAAAGRLQRGALPALTTLAAVAFVAFSVLMLWFAAVMIRAYNDARVKSDKIRKLWYTVVSDKNLAVKEGFL